MRSVRPQAEGRSPEPSLGVNAALSWLTFAGRAGFAFLATLLVARVLGPAGRGEVTYAVNLAGLAALLVSAGTGAALVNLRVGHTWTDDRLHSAALSASIVTGASFSVVAALLAVLFPAQRTTFLIAAIVSIPLVAAANLIQTAGLADRLGLVTWTALVGGGLYAAGTLVTAVTGVMTVQNNLAIWVVAAVVPVVLMIWPGRLMRYRSEHLRADTRTVLKSSLRMNVAAIAVLAIWRADVLLVEFRRGYEELGLYSVAVGSAEIVVALSVGLRTAVLPHQSIRDESRIADVLCFVTRLSLPLVTMLALLVAAVGPWGIAFLFGSEYRQSYPALVLLLPGVVLLVLHYPLFDYVIARGGAKTLTLMGVIGITVNVTLNLFVLRNHSYVAASVVSTLSYTIVFVWCLLAFMHRADRSAKSVLVLRRSDVREISSRITSLRPGRWS